MTMSDHMEVVDNVARAAAQEAERSARAAQKAAKRAGKGVNRLNAKVDRLIWIALSGSFSAFVGACALVVQLITTRH